MDFYKIHSLFLVDTYATIIENQNLLHVNPRAVCAKVVNSKFKANFQELICQLENIFGKSCLD